MGDQGIDQGAGLVARRRMDDEARRFVDDDQVAVLVDHGEGNGFGQRRWRRCLGDRHPDRFAAFQPVAPAGHHVALDSHAAFRNKALET